MENQYRLRIIKETQYIRNQWSTKFNFSVVDATINGYPKNFVCCLPLENVLKSKTFKNAFPEETDLNQFAISLLIDAKNFYQDKDLEVLAEISRRIKLLSPKPTQTMTCKGCGTHFEKVITKGKPTANYCPSCREAYVKKFQKICACGRTFNSYMGAEICGKCRKEQEPFQQTYYTSKKERPKAKLGFVSKSVRELLANE
jgi:hypothetical protein